MKGSLRLLTLAALFAPVLAHCNAQPFNGFYGALDLGVIAGVAKIDHSITFDTGVFFIGPRPQEPVYQTMTFANARPDNMGNASLLGSLIVGYSRTMTGCWLWGAEARAIANSLKMTDTLSFANGPQNSMNSVVYLKHQFALALLGKLGYMPVENTLFYGLVGPQWGKFKIHSESAFLSTNENQTGGFDTITANSLTDKNQYRLGWLLGLGIERWLACSLSVGLEYNFSYYGDLGSNDNVISPVYFNGVALPNGAFTDRIRIHTLSNTALIKVAYYFC